MLRLTDEQAIEVAAAVSAARGRAELRHAVADVHRRVQAEIDLRQPACSASGRCCRFEAYGHRLFVTTIELAVFADQLSAVGPSAGKADPATPAWDGTGCPYQVDGLCGVHGVRPFGCRIYFCDPTSTAWQQDLYERMHDELKGLHDQAQVAYYYVEWREALRAMGLAAAAADPVDQPLVTLRVARFAKRTQD